MIRFCPRCGGGDLQRKVPPRDDRERLCCSICGWVHYVGPVLAAGAILHDQRGRCCLVRRALEPGRGLWTFPGGFVDLEEEADEAALRETAEETGCAGEIEGLVGVYSSEGPKKKRVIIVVYSARHTGAATPKDHLIEEVAEVRWFHCEEIPWDRLAFPSTGLALRSFYEPLG